MATGSPKPGFPTPPRRRPHYDPALGLVGDEDHRHVEGAGHVGEGLAERDQASAGVDDEEADVGSCGSPPRSGRACAPTRIGVGGLLEGRRCRRGLVKVRSPSLASRATIARVTPGVSSALKRQLLTDETVKGSTCPRWGGRRWRRWPMGRSLPGRQSTVGGESRELAEAAMATASPPCRPPGSTSRPEIGSYHPALV